MKEAGWQKTIELLKLSCTAPAGMITFAYFIPSTTPAPLHVRQWSCENRHAWDRFKKSDKLYMLLNTLITFPKPLQVVQMDVNGYILTCTNHRCRAYKQYPSMIFAKKNIKTNTYFSCTFTRRANIFSCIGQVSSPIYIRTYMRSFSHKKKAR